MALLLGVDRRATERPFRLQRLAGFVGASIRPLRRVSLFVDAVTVHAARVVLDTALRPVTYLQRLGHVSRLSFSFLLANIKRSWRDRIQLPHNAGSTVGSRAKWS